jgi:ribosomal protein S18 acetylase RimI-like enzyme
MSIIIDALPAGYIPPSGAKVKSQKIMSQQPITYEASEQTLPSLTGIADAARVQQLDGANPAEVLDFLAVRPLQTVIMRGFIRDNGLSSPLNRGAFYAYRNELNELEGVALFGHVTMFEARSEAAIIALALAARCYPRIRVVVGEQGWIELFWRHYGEGKPSPRLVYHELLYDLRQIADAQAVEDLRPAALPDLELLLSVYAAMTFEVNGIDMLKRDPIGFRQRWEYRIGQGRVWVWMQDGELLFSASVAADTPTGAYIEGVHVNGKYRGKGYGLRCMVQLSRNLLTGASTICGFVDEQNKPARALYEKAGYEPRSHYQKFYL